MPGFLIATDRPIGLFTFASPRLKNENAESKSLLVTNWSDGPIPPKSEDPAKQDSSELCSCEIMMNRSLRPAIKKINKYIIS